MCSKEETNKFPKTKRDPKKAEGFCKCRPICKSRRREWRGKLQNTSAELLLERKPIPDCFRRCPTKVYPNGPCPLFGKTHHVISRPRPVPPPPVIRICQAPLDLDMDTPYLQYVEMAKRIGAWTAAAIKAPCPFCPCGGCCPCGKPEYTSSVASTAAADATARRADMRAFDARVRHGVCKRTMYDDI